MEISGYEPRTAAGALDELTDPASAETLRIKYGPDWREYLVPHPDEFDEASGIADLAPGAEDDTPPDRRGPNSLTLTTRIRSSCAGHPDPPTAAELHAAFHTREPSPRTDFLVLMWMSQATANEMIDAWRDHCYTWRELAEACRRHGIADAVNAPVMRAVGCRTAAAGRWR